MTENTEGPVYGECITTFISTRQCSNILIDAVSDYVDMHNNFTQQFQDRKGQCSIMTPIVIIRVMTRKGFVSMMIRSDSVNAQQVEILPIVFTSVGADEGNHELHRERQCIIPDEFKPSEIYSTLNACDEDTIETDEEQHDEYTMSLKRWINNFAEFVCRINAGGARSKFGDVTGFSSTFDEDAKKYNAWIQQKKKLKEL